MDYTQVTAYLNSLANYEKSAVLDADAMNVERCRALLNTLGNPQQRYRSVHIAGTKGKGSTCAFIFSVLREAGFTVGLYTSPHLRDVRERIKIASAYGKAGPEERVIAESELGALIADLKPFLDKIPGLTFFEALTVMAFKFFADQGCDFAVVETGLGGTWDATNIIVPLVAGLTSISLDHTQILGGTLEQIAAAKAGIIKENGLVVSAPQPPPAREVIARVCRERRATVYEVGRDIIFNAVSQDLERSVFDVRTLSSSYKALQISLLGAHQLVNAAVALGVIEMLALRDIVIPPSAVRRGLERTVWPGRFQIVRRNPYVVLDGAHNPAAAEALRRSLGALLPRRTILILGVSRDKDAAGISERLCPHMDRVIVTQARTPRAMPAPELAAVVRRFTARVQTAARITDALRIACRDIGPEEVILIAGSLYLIGEAGAALRTVNIPRGIAV